MLRMAMILDFTLLISWCGATISTLSGRFFIFLFLVFFFHGQLDQGVGDREKKHPKSHLLPWMIFLNENLRKDLSKKVILGKRWLSKKK
jgi:hypothetical protein